MAEGNRLLQAGTGEARRLLAMTEGSWQLKTETEAAWRRTVGKRGLSSFRLRSTYEYDPDPGGRTCSRIQEMRELGRFRLMRELSGSRLSWRGLGNSKLRRRELDDSNLGRRMTATSLTQLHMVRHDSRIHGSEGDRRL